MRNFLVGCLVGSHVFLSGLAWGIPGEVAAPPATKGAIMAENIPQDGLLKDVVILGGTPHTRAMVRSSLRLEPGQPFDLQLLQQDLKWILHNRFIPVTPSFESPQPGQVTLVLTLETRSGISPIVSASSSDLGGYGVILGALFNHVFAPGSKASLQIKRNNFKVLPGLLTADTPNLMQDWEFIGSWETEQMPLEGMSLGANVYNKVDYIFDHFRSQQDRFVWVRSIGADVYTGFPIWDDSQARRYLRGVVNVSVLQDTLFASEAGLATTLSQSGKPFDNYVMPSLTLLYSELDRIILPLQGHFIRGDLKAGIGETFYSQALLRSDSFVPLWAGESFEMTLLLQHLAGTTFGRNPFYRGFLNAGTWFVRGATEYSITDESSLKATQELRLIFPELTAGLGLPGWGAMVNFFVDEGAYWNRQEGLASDKWQIGAGVGVNLMTPMGLTMGIDFAVPLYPSFGGFGYFIRFVVPFWPYYDRSYTNGYFLR